MARLPQIQLLQRGLGAGGGDPPAPSPELVDEVAHLFELELTAIAAAEPDVDVDVHLMLGGGRTPRLLRLQQGQLDVADDATALESVFLDLTHPALGWGGPARSTPAVQAQGPAAQRLVELLASALASSS